MRFFLLFKVRQEIVEAADGNITPGAVDGQDSRSCRIRIVNRMAERSRRSVPAQATFRVNVMFFGVAEPAYSPRLSSSCQGLRKRPP
jgi:hypothetical protein